MVEDWLSAVLGARGKYTLGLEALQPWRGQERVGKSGDDLTSIFIERWNGMLLLICSALENTGLNSGAKKNPYKTTLHSWVAILTQDTTTTREWAGQAAEVIALTEESEFRSYPKFKKCLS